MTLRNKTLTAALALAVCVGGPALAQDAATPAPAQQPAGTQQSSEPTAAPAPADQTDAGQATPAQAPADPVEAGSGETPAGESATAPTQSSEPTSAPAGAEQTPMEAPEVPSVTATEGETPAEAPAEEAPAAEADAAPADAAAEPAAEEPAAEATAADPAAEEPAAAEPAEAEQGAGQEAGDAVQVTEGDEAAAPAETTGTVVAEEGHDDIEGAGEDDASAAEGGHGEAEGEEHAAASHGAAHIEDIAFSFEGPFGKYDQFQLQRGLQVYTEVCSACHGMKFVPIRTLHDDGGPGLPEDQVRAYAANLTAVLDPETGEERPRLPTDHFPTVTGEGMGPDLSLMAKARAAFHGPYGTGISQLVNGIGGPEYIHALLTGYTGEEVEQAGSVLYENTAFAGGLIGMPPPLSEDLVTYEDGTPATADQMARDVAAFMMWTAEPKLTDRKQVGLVAVLLLIVLTSLLYLTNKRLWAPHKGKKLHR